MEPVIAAIGFFLSLLISTAIAVIALLHLGQP